MPAAWKKNKNLKPEVILKRIESIRTVDSEGKTSFSGFELKEALAVLHTMVDFQGSADELNKPNTVWRAVAKVVGPMTPDSFMKVLNEEIVKQKAVKDTEFRILTALSLDQSLFPKALTIDGSKLELLPNHYGKRYAAREALIENARLPVPSLHPDYCRVIVSVKAKGVFGAITKALKVLDVQRAIWCMLGNPNMQFGNRDWSPINVIRLGTVHSIHRPSGEPATQEVWFEPNFVEAPRFRPAKPKQFRENAAYLMRCLFASAYHEKLVEALLRYVRAFDERDQNTAFIKVWGALETLACPGSADYAQIVKRCAFLHKDAQYHRQVLEHLREYRNQSVHAGDQAELAKTHCYQAQGYFASLFCFHLRNVRTFTSLDDANSFLDLPRDIELLRRREKMARKAIRFVM